MHISVLLQEVLQYFDPHPGENFIDCTINGGGHSLAILERTSPDGKLLGIDWDDGVLKKLEIKIEEKGFRERVIFVNDNFANLRQIVQEKNFHLIQGILLDLGWSMEQLEEGGRGFSFKNDEPLDMRYNKNATLTAREIVNQWRERDLVDILEKYSDERFARRIAYCIVEERKIKPIETTLQLVEIIRSAVSGPYRYQRIHFATRTFQALRITVNQELDNLHRVLSQAVDILKKDGRLIIISFHSAEDRIVKNFFKKAAEVKQIEILTKRPVVASRQEILFNPPSSSAKLRVAQKK